MPNAALPLADFAAALRPRIAGDLRLDAMSRALYATDASMYQIEPVGVLLPRHPDDIQAAVEEAARFGIPVLPRGSGSSLAGSAVGAALVIDTSLHLHGIGPVDAEARTVTVQPGVVLDTLNAHLASYGLEFGPDPAEFEPRHARRDGRDERDGHALDHLRLRHRPRPQRRRAPARRHARHVRCARRRGLAAQAEGVAARRATCTAASTG